MTVTREWLARLPKAELHTRDRTTLISESWRRDAIAAGLTALP